MTRLFILAAGLAGFAVVGRAAAYYKDVDGFAYGVTWVMMAALAFGIGELLFRSTRTARLAAELKKLPQDADLEVVDASSPTLRALLRSHLERSPMPWGGAVFVPYLVGLLVMLGLLGTFLGLFETLRGARDALTTSGDVEALRAGLAQPMAGLMRSFGTSAAGVASSAMLGFGAVFARRSHQRLALALHHCAAGPLARFSPARRQLIALEALAVQGDALPAAAEALNRAVEGIDALRSTWAETQAENARQNADAVRATSAEVRDDLKTVASRIDELATSLAATEEESRAAQVAALKSAAGELRAELSDVSRSLAGLGEDWSEAQASASRDAAERVAEATAAVHGDLEATTLAIAALEEGVRAAYGDAATRTEKVVADATAHMRKDLGATVEGIAALESSWSEAHDAAVERTGTMLESVAKDVRAELRTGIAGAASAAKEAALPLVREAIDGTVAAATLHLEEVQQVVEAGVAERRDLEAQSAARLDGHLEAVQGQVEAGVAQRRALEEATAERLAAHVVDVVERLDAGLEHRRSLEEVSVKSQAAHVAKVVEHLDKGLAERSKLEEVSVGRQAAHVAKVVERLDAGLEHRRALEEQSVGRQAAHVAEVVEHLDAGLEHRRALEEQSIARHDVHVAEVVERLDLQVARRAESDAALVARLETHAERLHEAEAERTLQLTSGWQEVTAKLREAFEETAERDGARAETLGAVAARMQEDLAGATAVVRERLEANASADAKQQERTEVLFERLAGASTAITDAATSQVGALEKFVEASDGRVRAAEERAEERAEELLTRIGASVTAQAERVAAFEAELLARHEAGAQGLAGDLATHAASFGEGLAQTTALVHEAAGLVHAGGAELTATAEMFAGSVDRHGDAAKDWLDSLGAVERSVAEAGEGAAVEVLGQYLARTHELFDQQLAFQQELFEQLRSARKVRALTPTTETPAAPEEEAARASA